MCLDAGYVGERGLVEKMGYKAHNPQYEALRWVVEVCHSWMNWFRKLLVRYALWVKFSACGSVFTPLLSPVRFQDKVFYSKIRNSAKISVDATLDRYYC
jgi:hypothetical protein